MAVTYGFYNALNHDRLYDAIQMSSIFDGIIRDGVFSTIGESLICKASENGLVVNVGAGRAWFNHTWTLNDTDYPVEAEQAEVVLDRIDAIVLEVNSAVEVRANTIKFIKGTPSSNPVRPTLVHNAEVNQYALAYVNIRAGQTTIFQADIINVVGTDETPFITGLLQQLSIEELIIQWEAEFDDHFTNWQAVNETNYQLWTTDMQNQYSAWVIAKMNEYAQWYANMQTEGDANLAEFDAWFQSMKDQLSTDAAGHLQAEIDQLALEAGKGSVLTVHTDNTSLYGRTVTVRQNDQIQTALFDNTGTAVFDNMPYIGSISITSTDGSQTASTTMNIPYFGRYSVNIAFWAATVYIDTTSTEFYNRNINVYKNDVLVSTIAFDNAGNATYVASSAGTYKFVVTYDGTTFDSSVNVTTETTYTTTINAWIATLNMTATISDLYERAITISKGGQTVGTTAFDNNGHASYKVHEAGTYTVTTSTAGGDTFTKTVEVTEETGYDIELGTVTKEISLYSAASDTVTFSDLTGEKTAVTNASGLATVSVTIIPSGTEITFTSRIAKNPDNLSDAYSKTITVTAEDTEIKVMPDGAIYWWGYASSDCTLNSGMKFASYGTGSQSVGTNSISFKAWRTNTDYWSFYAKPFTTTMSFNGKTTAKMIGSNSNTTSFWFWLTASPITSVSGTTSPSTNPGAIRNASMAQSGTRVLSMSISDRETGSLGVVDQIFPTSSSTGYNQVVYALWIE